MRIREISLQPFRNLSQTRLQLADRGALIVAPNGTGKSNVLEAISFLSLGKSVRGVRDREAVPHGGEYFDIRAVWHDGQRDRQLRLCYAQGQGKRVYVDGAALDRVSDVVTLLQTVHFCPEDVALVLRFPAQRRRLLDILISQSDVAYLHNLQRYQRIVAQRNQSLRRFQTTDSQRELEPWNLQIARVGASLRHMRMRVLVEFQPALEQYYGRFSTGREQLMVTYRGVHAAGAEGASLATPETLCDELQAELIQMRERERHAGHTLCGPHRDALSFELDGEAAETFASQGQMKSVLVAWKMAELRFLEARGGQQPVLLLDDVFSELDGDRTGELMKLISDFDQVVMTAPRQPRERLPERFAEVELVDGAA